MIPADVLKFPGRVNGPESVGFAPFRVSSVGIAAKFREGQPGIGCPPIRGQWGPRNLEAKSVPPFLRAPATTPATPFSPNVRKAAGRTCRRGENNRGGGRGPRFNIIQNGYPVLSSRAPGPEEEKERKRYGEPLFFPVVLGGGVTGYLRGQPTGYKTKYGGF